VPYVRAFSNEWGAACVKAVEQNVEEGRLRVRAGRGAKERVRGSTAVLMGWFKTGG